MHVSLPVYRGQLLAHIWKEDGLLPLSLASPITLNLCGAKPDPGHKCASGSSEGQGKGPGFGRQVLELLARGNDCREYC